MDRFNNSQKKTIGLLVLLVFLAGLLSYSLITSITHKRHSRYARQALILPQLAPPTEMTSAEIEQNPWTTILAEPGDSLASIFKRVGLSRQILQTLLYKNKYAKNLTRIKPNQQIQFRIKENQLEEMIFPISVMEALTITAQGNGFISKIKLHPTSTQNEFITATVQGSLYSTAKKMNIPYKLIRQMTDIFHWEIDFAKEIRAGDQFSIVYQAYYIEDKLVDAGEILAVRYINRGKTYEAIRYASANGDVEYYTPQGHSLKKAFTRYPVKFSHISSTYSLSRYHPVLHYRRPHKGVDLAAAIGTPVHATGDGRIEIIERHNGYGNMVKISHRNGYASVYAHLLRFQKGLSRGAYVKQGQVIGYVGQTGLADGPHCHYEFHVNHQPRNPSTIELPRGLPIPTRNLTAFQTKAHTLLAQLKLYETATLAAAGKKVVNNT